MMLASCASLQRRRVSIEESTKGRRQDLVGQAEAEMGVPLAYLPQQMSQEEIRAVARQVIQEVAAFGTADKGKVMPRLISQLQARADGREINVVVPSF